MEAIAANIWVNASSTKSNYVDFVRVLAIRGIVEPIVNLGLGGEQEEDAIEI